MSEVLKMVEQVLPPAKPGVPGSSIRRGKDAVKIAVAISSSGGRATQEIARRFNVNKDTLRKFKRAYVTPEVQKVVMAHTEELQSEALDKKIVDVQQAVHGTLVDVSIDLRHIVERIKDILDDQNGDDYLTRLAPLVKTLDMQGKTAQRMADSFAKLRKDDLDKLPLNRHPDAARLAALLALVFSKHPDARDTFMQVQGDMNLILDS